ncbi:MAG: alanine:cation symporter family protein, partial [Phocaeicola sp.]
FAFSTLLGWAYYGEKSIEYLGGSRLIKYYRMLWIVAVFIGSIINLALVWAIADSMNALMAIPNLISLLLLSNVVVKETRKYLWEDRLDEVAPEEMES